MIPTLYERIEYVLTTKAPTWTKLGSLTDAISCVETSSINSEWEMVLEYPMNGRHANELQIMRIVWTTQPFYVYRIAKNVSAHVMTVYCRHINYLLSFVPAWPFSNDGFTPADFLTKLSPEKNVFNITSEITTKRDIKMLTNSVTPSNLRDFMLNESYGIVAFYGGEWVFDGLKCTLKARKGATKNVTIRYGVDLVDAKQEEAVENLVTHIIPYVYLSDQVSKGEWLYDTKYYQTTNSYISSNGKGTRYGVNSTIPAHYEKATATPHLFAFTDKAHMYEQIIANLTDYYVGSSDVYALPGANQIPFKHIEAVNLLENQNRSSLTLINLSARTETKTTTVTFQTGNIYTTDTGTTVDNRTSSSYTDKQQSLLPSSFIVKTQNLRTLAQEYVNSHPITFPVSITVESLPAFMNGVKLGDTITVKFEDYGINTQAEIMTMEYDVLRDQIKSYTLGTGRTSFAQTMLNQSNRINLLNGLVTANNPLKGE
jgi:phage minor structural protein